MNTSKSLWASPNIKRVSPTTHLKYNYVTMMWLGQHGYCSNQVQRCYRVFFTHIWNKMQDYFCVGLSNTWEWSCGVTAMCLDETERPDLIMLYMLLLNQTLTMETYYCNGKLISNVTLEPLNNTGTGLQIHILYVPYTELLVCFLFFNAHHEKEFKNNNGSRNRDYVTFKAESHT